MGKGDVKVAIIGDASSLVGAFGKASAVGSAFSGVFAGVGMAFGQDLMHMAKEVANFAGDSIGKFMDWGTQVRTVARETGMSWHDASEFAVFAKQTGVQTEDLTQSMKFFDKAVINSTGTFEKYGVTVRDANGAIRPTKDILGDLSDVFVGLGDGPESAALAMKLFGKNGMAMLPMLMEGKEGLMELSSAAEQSGLVLDEQSKTKWAEARKASRDLSITWEGLQVQIGQFLVPALTSVAQWVGEHLPAAIAGAKQWFADHKQDFINVKDAAVDLWHKLEDLGNWWTDHIGTMEDFHNGLDKIHDSFVSIGDWWTEHIGTWEDFSNGLQIIGGWADWAGDKLGWLKDHVLDPLVGTIQDLTNKWDEFTNNPFLSILGGPLGMAKNVPMHAAGGTLGQGWSTVGEHGPESVFTAGGVSTVFPGGKSAMNGTPSINLNVNVSNSVGVDGDKIGRQLVAVLRPHLRSLAQ